MPSESRFDTAEREFGRLKRLADGALEQVPRDRYFEALVEDGNSIAILVKHLGGNLRSRWADFLASDGEKPWRDRDAEFEIGPDDSRESLEERWEEGWMLLFDALRGLGSDDEERPVSIRGETLTAYQAVQRQLTHYAYHVGQIVFLARTFAGGDWRSLSVPRGESKRFNAAPDPYL
jgi:hypothetical protein